MHPANLHEARILGRFWRDTLARNLFPGQKQKLDVSRYEERFGDLPRYIAGWYCYCPSQSLKAESVLGKRYMGREMVAYRRHDGEAVVTGGICPHQGANFANGGRVVRGNLRCPFHGFEFDRGVPVRGASRAFRERACNRAPCYPTREANGVVWFWYDPSATNGVSEPHWELDVADLSAFSRRAFVRTQAAAHIIQFFENIFDPDHFSVLHGNKNTSFDYQLFPDKPHQIRGIAAFDSEVLSSSWLKSLSTRMGNAKAHISFDYLYQGLGYNLQNISAEGYEFKMSIYATPVEDEFLDVIFVVYSKPHEWSAMTSLNDVLKSLIVPKGVPLDCMRLFSEDVLASWTGGHYTLDEQSLDVHQDMTRSYRRWVRGLLGERVAQPDHAHKQALEPATSNGRPRNDEESVDRHSGPHAAAR